MHIRAVTCSLMLFLAAGCGAHEASGPANSVSTGTDPVGSRPAKWFFERGQEAARANDSLRAEQYLTVALDKGYPRERVVPILLRACVSSFRLRAALGYAEPELRRRPDDAGLRYLVSTLLLGLGEPDEARSNLEELLQKNDAFAEAHYLLGALDIDRFGEPGAATAHFERYLELSPHGDHASEVRGRLDDLRALRGDRERSRAVAKNADRPRRVR
jgi:tetratricopeptide (TPR) repeat protein